MYQSKSDNGWTARRIVIVLALIGSPVGAIATIILGPQALPIIDKEFNTDQGAWFITSELLASAVLCPVFARLSDLYGKRRIILVAMFVGSVGSLVVALAPTFSVLLLGRAMQGTLIVCTALGPALVRQIFPARIAPLAVGLIATGGGLPGALVPFITGPIMDSHGYRGVFFGIAIVTTALSFLIFAVVPEGAVNKAGSVDLVGAILLGGSVASLLAGVTLGSGGDWTSPLAIVLIVGGLVLGAAWIWTALLKPEPLIDIRILADRRVANSVAAGGLVAGTGTLFLIVSALVAEAKLGGTFGFGLSATQYAGLQCLYFFGFFLGGVIPVYAVHRFSFGFVQSALSGALLLSGLVVLVTLNNLPGFTVIHLVAGFAVGGFFSIMFNFLLSEAAEGRQASTSALYLTVTTMVQSVFAAIPISIAYGLYGSGEGSAEGLKTVQFMAVFAIVATVVSMILVVNSRRGVDKSRATEVVRDLVDI